MKLQLVLCVAALGACAIGDPNPADPSTPGSSYTPVSVDTSASTFVPSSLDTSPVMVVVEMQGEPVAIRQHAAGRRLTRSEKDGIRAERIAEHATIQPQIVGLGGYVIGDFQSAINGIKVMIPHNRLGALRALPGVIDVKAVATHRRLLTTAVPRIHAPEAWAGFPGLRGEGVKIAIIDSGIDYTHADFGGPGTKAAYLAAASTDTEPASPLLFGPNAPKVKGGIDLVGDAYDGTNTPVADPNPLDCAEFAHGTFVAGVASGFGVLADGTTYRGPYNPSIYTTQKFSIGPGVAPKAELYAIRVFGCTGDTHVITEAIDWAIDHDVDVINLSLGSSFGTSNDADSAAADNAVKAGIVVVAAAGNDGDIRYVTAGPSTSSGTISVGALDTPATRRAAIIGVGGPAGITALDNNDAVFASATLPVKVLRNADGTVSFGCDLADYTDVAGKLVVAVRGGVCGRVTRAIDGQKQGAAAVVLINNAAGLPPFEGPITANPITGEPFVVTIPFFGVTGPLTSADATALLAADGISVRLTAEALPTNTAAFSSGGPRNGDGILKPDIAAPGNPIISAVPITASFAADNGSFSGFGTSHAAPQVSGVAALVLQAHPKWSPLAVKAAIINTGEAAPIGDYAARRNGAGIVNALSAAHTTVYAEADPVLVTANFGVQEFASDFAQQKVVRLHNTGFSPATFQVGETFAHGSPHHVSFDKQIVVVPAGGQAQITFTLTVPVATAGDASAFRDVAGLISFTPLATSTSANGGIALVVPYYLVPRVAAAVTVAVTAPGKATVANESAVPATASFFAWGLTKPASGLGQVDLRAAGFQTAAVAAFAINTHQPWSNASSLEFDVNVDTNGDGVPDFVVFAVDIGRLTTGVLDGRIASAVFDVTAGTIAVNFLATTSTDASTIVLPFRLADIGLTAANPRLSYTVSAVESFGAATDAFSGSATFDAFVPAISTGQFARLPGNSSEVVDFTVDPTAFAAAPPLGLMVVTPDNRNGAAEAALVPIAP